MTLCVLCAEPTLGDGEVCVVHFSAHGAEWATGNRIMCDFLHRGIVPPAPPDRLNALDVPTETLDEALVP